MQNTSLDIVQLIEKNPITRLSSTYQGKLLNKIKNEFTGDQQQLFVTNFYCFLNYDSKKDFVIDLDSVWKWLGFGRKSDAKRVLVKHFNIDIDYKEQKAVAEVAVAALEVQKDHSENKVKNLGGAGHSKEKILIAVTF